MKKNWDDFLKVMDHQFSDTPSLSQTGYEMDGESGLRNHCYNILNISLHGVKACDYLYKNLTAEYACIEFSDLAKMKKNFPLSEENIADIKTFIKPQKTGIALKQSYKKIDTLSFSYFLKKEIAKKIQDTDSLLINIKSHSNIFFKDTQPKLHDKLKPFYVVWNDPNSDDEDLSRVFDLISDDVNNEINSLNLKEIKKEVYIVTLSNLFA